MVIGYMLDLPIPKGNVWVEFDFSETPSSYTVLYRYSKQSSIIGI